MRTTHITRTALPALVALAALTACSQEPEATPGAAPSRSPATGSPPASSAPPVDTAALEESVRAYVKAYYGPDTGAAYALLSTRCRKEWSEEQFGALADRASQTAEQLGKTYTVRRLSVDDIHASNAQVTYGVGEPTYDERSSWVLEDGDWHNDLC
ncbi:hypothetical protein ACFYQ5_10765 [Streptomyces sp. NPDC005794]|uniref:hypothetical protein n=1 Tax=Streptomyces sp. NPDC005794 TaxID=3364733 RepID=UPI0036A0F7F5